MRIVVPSRYLRLLSPPSCGGACPDPVHRPSAPLRGRCTGPTSRRPLCLRRGVLSGWVGGGLCQGLCRGGGGGVCTLSFLRSLSRISVALVPAPPPRTSTQTPSLTPRPAPPFPRPLPCPFVMPVGGTLAAPMPHQPQSRLSPRPPTHPPTGREAAEARLRAAAAAGGGFAGLCGRLGRRPEA